MEPIVSFKTKEHRWLSSFWPAKIEFEGIIYPTVEHAYQAAKTVIPEERDRFKDLKKPGDAKRLGRNITLRDNWDSIKLQIMETLIKKKFSIPELRQKLQETKGRELIEGNTWGDRFWGICNGEGQNHLGKLLMKIRAN